MFLYDWFNSFMVWAGFKENAKIVFLGLDNAGKTTLLSVLKTGSIKSAAPTGHPQKDEIQINGVNFMAFDLGGHPSMREIWKTYCAEISGIIYMVDANNFERFDESRRELEKILENESLKDVPICVLGNKIDISTAKNEEELSIALGISMKTTGKGKKKTEGERPLEIFMCSVVRKQGYDKGFEWIIRNC